MQLLTGIKFTQLSMCLEGVGLCPPSLMSHSVIMCDASAFNLSLGLCLSPRNIGLLVLVGDASNRTNQCKKRTFGGHMNRPVGYDAI